MYNRVEGNYDEAFFYKLKGQIQFMIMVNKGYRLWNYLLKFDNIIETYNLLSANNITKMLLSDPTIRDISTSVEFISKYESLSEGIIETIYCENYNNLLKSLTNENENIYNYRINEEIFNRWIKIILLKDNSIITKSGLAEAFINILADNINNVEYNRDNKWKKYITINNIEVEVTDENINDFLQQEVQV